MYIYIYFTMVCLYNYAKVQPELSRPKLDLVLHRILQAFRPQMPGTGHTSKPFKTQVKLPFWGPPFAGPEN